MADYANDEEQLDALKSWWSENGQTVIIGAVVGISLVIGVNVYTRSRTESLQAASALYQQQYANGEVSEEVDSTELVNEYGGTPYATLASLADAKRLATEGDMEGAVAKLNWVVDKADQPAVKAQAQLRLAALLLAQQQYEAALAIVNTIELGSYGASIEELKGDIAAAQGDLETARNAYQGALTLVEKSLPQHQAIIQLKLDGLGSL